MWPCSVARQPWFAIAVFLALVLCHGPLRAAGPPPEKCTTVLRVALNETGAGVLLTSAGATESGPLVDLLRKAAARVGCELALQRMPLVRALVELDQGHFDFAVPVAGLPERFERLQFPMTVNRAVDRRLMVATANTVAYVLASRAAEVQALMNAKAREGLRVAVYRGTTSESIAQAAGWPINYVVTPDRAMAMLRLGRVEAVIATHWAFAPSTLEVDPPVVTLSPPLRQTDMYVPASLQMWQRDPHQVEKFWHALCVESELQGHPPAHACPHP